MQMSTLQLFLCHLAGFFILACFAWVVIGPLLFGSFTPSNVQPRHWTIAKGDYEAQRLAKWTVPSNVKVVGLVFYGRRRTASILSCYLEVSREAARVRVCVGMTY